MGRSKETKEQWIRSNNGKTKRNERTMDQKRQWEDQKKRKNNGSEATMGRSKETKEQWNRGNNGKIKEINGSEATMGRLKETKETIGSEETMGIRSKETKKTMGRSK